MQRHPIPAHRPDKVTHELGYIWNARALLTNSKSPDRIALVHTMLRLQPADLHAPDAAVLFFVGRWNPSSVACSLLCPLTPLSSRGGFC